MPAGSHLGVFNGHGFAPHLRWCPSLGPCSNGRLNGSPALKSPYVGAPRPTPNTFR